MFAAGPSPSGRGWREAPGEGEHAQMFRCEHPHPALRATFSPREKDSPENLQLTWTVLLPQGERPRLLESSSAFVLRLTRTPQFGICAVFGKDVGAFLVI